MVHAIPEVIMLTRLFDLVLDSKLTKVMLRSTSNLAKMLM